MGLLDIARKFWGEEKKQSLAEMHALALKEFQGKVTDKDFAQYQSALHKLGWTPKDFENLLWLWRRREELREKAANIEALEMKAVSLAQAHQDYFDETTKVINDRSNKLCEMKALAHEASVRLDNAKEAFRELQAFEFDNRETFALDIDLHKVTPTYKGSPAPGREDAPKVEVSYLAYINESYRRHELFKKECAARNDRWKRDYKNWEFKKKEFEERNYPEPYKVAAPVEPEPPLWTELLPAPDKASVQA